MTTEDLRPRDFATGRLSRADAVEALTLRDYADLLVALGERGLVPPRPTDEEAEAEAALFEKLWRESMRTWLAITLVALAAPAQASTIPVRPGFYARADRPCAIYGDAAAYAVLLHVDADGVSDSGHARKVVHMREENGAIVVDQWSEDLRAGGERASLSWVVRVMAPETFVMLGADGSTDWSGQWRWCGDPIP